MRRVKTTCTLAPNPPYQPEAIEAEAYVTRPDSRWAVTRAPRAKHWGVTHRGSGIGVSSILPVVPGGLSMTRILNVVRAWESAPEIDLSPFDALDHLGATWEKSPPRAMVNAMRQIAALA